MIVFFNIFFRQRYRLIFNVNKIQTLKLLFDDKILYQLS